MIIGITGRKRSGKTTLATALAASLSPPAAILAFADPLRSMLYRLDPFVLHATDPGIVAPLSRVIDAYGWEGVKDSPYGPEVRRLLQRLGTDAVRTEDPHFWVHSLDERRFALPPHTHVIIPDVRFHNEAAYCDYVFRVDRPSDGPSADHHISEDVDTLPADTVITNDGTPTQMVEQALEALRTYL